ncbi:mRNA-binding protein Encore [Plasmopara halstedii]|uniref:mRNA-binding protein Encore n=1 Tax=Plasmopara halstedii TaxID=4781 RepID=A0A0P1B1T9_PLAHL|nr:mRNA-binding protein Encore [Plasmopara halstedii]CEG47937.1 mRNA-binding protein Encore [Plasmopara halstedii]|eukprot:XP_024584306.1 mRNA-binding protein Encore [Plasmopara halstedii]
MISTSMPAAASPSPVSQDNHDLWETANINSSADTSTNSVQISELLSTASRTNDVEDATLAMQGLRILQPPPAADNGGNYAQQLNASAPVGTATASAHGPLDPVLVAGLENARERMTLLQFEDQIVRFLRNPKEPHLNFPPLSSYHRLIVHRLAQRCGLEHQTADYNPYDNSSARVVTLFKTPQSAVPLVLLIDLSSDRQAPTSTPASAPRIMMRKCSAPRPGVNGGRGNSADKATPSLQDRERAYAEARARIFGEEDNSTAAEIVILPSPTISLVQDDSKNDDGLGNAGPRHGCRQAVGPDGSKGFGRGKETIYSSGNTTGSRPRSPKARPGGNDSTVHSRSSIPSAPNAANWKESKVLWRNREQEMNDPDFTRNHDAFRPRSSGGASSGSGSGGESPHYGYRVGGGMVRYGLGDQSQQYDRSFGYQHQQNASSPQPTVRMGSGRGHYYIGGPEFSNRVDMNQYQRASHHPQQQNHPHQANPPLCMLMGRGGYGFPSPNGHTSVQQGNWLPPHANSRVVGSGSSGFIDDDFPPLGK